ncbi:STAS domain-containing protein [Candidatus Pelagibacter sp. HIMB1746]|uniref:STAS domain-containing protein n=1 Tax=Candidatus Pelagibacter sp. HIMB1746 TaxID=3413370 RepID=UPI003F83F720
MSYPEKTENDVLIITVSGEIDLENSGNLRQQVQGALDDNKAVSVDMSAVNYIDSSGIAVLIESKQRAGEGSKEFKIVKPSEAVVSVLKLAKLTSFFDIEN